MSEKGQIAIPVDLGKASEIAPGEKLMVLRRRDGSGSPLVKLSAMGDLMQMVVRGEDLFLKINGKEVEHEC